MMHVHFNCNKKIANHESEHELLIEPFQKQIPVEVIQSKNPRITNLALIPALVATLSD